MLLLLKRRMGCWRVGVIVVDSVVEERHGLDVIHQRQNLVEVDKSGVLGLELRRRQIRRRERRRQRTLLKFVRLIHCEKNDHDDNDEDDGDEGDDAMEIKKTNGW